MELKSVFSIVLPIIHNYKTHTDMKKLDSLFLNCPLKRSSQLFDSPLLGVGSPLLACLELRQSQRRKAGVHQNESHTYLLKRGNIPFTVGKIKLWVYKGGIGFITIDISSGPLCDSILLDLTASLSNVITRPSIIYEQAVARGSYKTVNTSIQQIMENICGLTEAYSNNPIRTACQRAMCLFYGFGAVEDNDRLLYFLEMLRSQNTNSRSITAGLQSEYCFHTYTYITCAVSENVLAVVGDVKSAGDDNRFFLEDNGGLRQSVCSNYLPVYLTCLSINLRLQKLQNDFNLYDVHALKLCPDVAVCELRDIMNTPWYDLTSERHINELFKTYLCDRVLKISEKLQKLSGDENFRYI